MNMEQYLEYMGDLDLSNEHLETCVACGRRFPLMELQLDGDGQFRCAKDSQGANPATVAQANKMLVDHYGRKPGPAPSLKTGRPGWGRR